MIVGIGIDIIEVDRVRQQLKDDEKIKYSLFSNDEIEYCNSKITWAQSYAGKFAAKEALLKALGTGLRSNMKYTDIEIKNNDSGQPNISVKAEVANVCDKLKIDRILVSISHIKDIATAMVIIENSLRRK